MQDFCYYKPTITVKIRNAKFAKCNVNAVIYFNKIVYGIILNVEIYFNHKVDEG